MLFSNFKELTPLGKLKIECWSNKNLFSINEITCGSQKKVWFNCDICNHDFESRLDGVTKKNGTWCPYCKNKKLCPDSNCKICIPKSFQAYEGKTSKGKLKIECYSDKNKEKPNQIFLKTHKKCSF